MKIKFRAKAWDYDRFGKDYYYGNIIIQPDGDIWLYPFNGKTQFKALENTVSQYIGLKDKNGNELYLGDKFKLDEKVYTIVFVNGSFGFYAYENNPYSFETFHDLIVTPVHTLPQSTVLTVIDSYIQEIELIQIY